MKHPFRILVAMLFTTLFTLSGCKKQPEAKNIVLGKIERIYSDILDEERKVYVHMPEERDDNDSIKYPVLYLMDGDGHFKSVVGLMHQLSSVNGNTVCPKMIIVAITNTNRSRDLTPTQITSREPGGRFAKDSGGGENFTAFIADELIPYIDAHYPTTNERILVGHSLGGLMVINTLIKHNDLFDKYLAIDPSLWWDDQKSLEEYEQGLRDKDLKGKSLFISIANTVSMDTAAAQLDTSDVTDHFRSIMHFTKTLRDNKTHGLDWQAKYYPDESHGSVPLISEYEGFRFLFRKIQIAMELSKLKQFEGKYRHQFKKGVDSFLDVVAGDNLLLIKESWRDREMQFSPVGEVDFYAFENHFPVKFRRNVNGEIFQLVAFETDVWEKVE